jgi:site-specific DNA-methyltransferase (adenine-specific)
MDNQIMPIPKGVNPRKSDYTTFTFCGDCLEKMKELDDASVDMILCDLPYGVTHNPHDKRLPFDLLWKEYERIIKDTGAIVLFAQGMFYVDLVASNRKLFRYDMVWDKVLTTGFLNAKKMPLRQHEQIAVFYKQLPTYNPQFHEGKPLHGRGNAYKSKDMINNNYGAFKATDDVRKGSTQKYPTSIVKVNKPHPSASNHRTEKPIQLLEYLIRTYTNPGEVVLDNCMGAGGCAVAALNTGRRFVGMEIDEEYYRIAEDRIIKAHHGDVDLRYDLIVHPQTSVHEVNLKMEASNGELKTELVE